MIYLENLRFRIRIVSMPSYGMKCPRFDSVLLHHSTCIMVADITPGHEATCIYCCFDQRMMHSKERLYHRQVAHPTLR